MYIYILELRGGFYYIGRTNNLRARYQAHLQGSACAWTRIHKPVRIIESIKSDSTFDEDKYTKEYMLKYGIDRVRGGTYANPILDEEQFRTLQKEIWGAQNLCFKCGGNHFVKDCNKLTERKEKAQEIVSRLNSSISSNWRGDMINYHTNVTENDRELLLEYKPEILEILVERKNECKLISAFKAGISAFMDKYKNQ